MNYKVEATPEFLAQSKKLSKKYPSFKDDLASLAVSLAENPTQGTSLGKDCYKVRLSISSKGKGKSGGARVITLVIQLDTVVYLLTVYDKSEKENVSDSEIKRLIKDITATKKRKK